MKELTSRSNRLIVGSKAYFDYLEENKASVVPKVEHDLEHGASHSNFYMTAGNILRLRQELDALGRMGVDIGSVNMYLDRLESRSADFFDGIEGRAAAGRARQPSPPRALNSGDPLATQRALAEQLEQEMNDLKDSVRHAPEFLRDFIFNALDNMMDAVTDKATTATTSMNTFADSLAYFSRSASNSLVQVATNVLAAAESSITFEVEFGAGIGGGKRLLVGDIRGDLLTVKEVRTFDIRGNLINAERLVGADIKLATAVGGLAELRFTEQRAFEVDDDGRATRMERRYARGPHTLGSPLEGGDMIISIGGGVYFGFGGGGTIYFNLSEFARELEKRFG